MALRKQCKHACLPMARLVVDAALLTERHCVEQSCDLCCGLQMAIAPIRSPLLFPVAQSSAWCLFRLP